MKSGMKYKQRDIVLIPFPYTDFSSIKQRPALIISNKKMDKMQDFICCLVTSNPTKEGILIRKDSFEEEKLPFKSWIKPYRIFTIYNKIIRKKLCTITNDFYEEVLKEILVYLRRD